MTMPNRKAPEDGVDADERRGYEERKDADAKHTQHVRRRAALVNRRTRIVSSGRTTRNITAT